VSDLFFCPDRNACDIAELDVDEVTGDVAEGEPLICEGHTYTVCLIHKRRTRGDGKCRWCDGKGCLVCETKGATT